MKNKSLLYFSLLIIAICLLSFLTTGVYAIDDDLSNLDALTSVTIKIGDNNYTVENKNDIDGLNELKKAIDNYRKNEKLNSYEKIYEQTINLLIEYASSISTDNIQNTIYYYNNKFYSDKEHTEILYKEENTEYTNMEDVINNAVDDLVISLLTQYTVKTNETWSPTVNIILFRGDSDGKRFIEVNQNLTLTMKPTESGTLTIDGYGQAIKTSYTPMRASSGSIINIHERVVIKEFWCTTNGGVMYLDGGTINIYGGIFYHNTAGQTGGFISCKNGDFNVYDGIFANNKSTTGGGVFTLKYENNTGKVNFSGGVFVNNTSTSNGGVIHMTSGSLSMENTVIYGNSTSKSGGVIYLSSGTFEMTNSLIYNNVATTNGGAIYMVGGNFEINSGYMGIENDESDNERGNIATNGSGGGIYVSGGNVLIEGGEISYNLASTSNGGGVYVTGGTFIMNNGNITNNLAINGGGVYVSGGNVTVNNGVIDANKATNTGGGLYAESSSQIEIDILGGEIKNNTADISGGGIGLNISSSSNSILNIGGKSIDEISLNALIISNNTAPTSGGGMYIHGNIIVNVLSGTISNNKTSGTGGGMNITNDGEVRVYGGIIKNNSSNSDGAGVNIGSNGKFTMEGGQILNNISLGNGGGVYLDSGNYIMSSGYINNNKATNGGGAYVNSAIFSLTGGEFNKNVASSNGGGFYIGDNSSVSLEDGSIINNEATNGGGFYQTQTDNETITNISGNCLIDSNKAVDGNGGGVYIDGGSTFRMIGGKVTYNQATAETLPEDGTLAKNSQLGVGGGVYILNGIFTMYDESNEAGNAAIFGNEADYAADDLFAFGENTSFDAISVANMSKADAYKTADSWFEDYPSGESHTTLNYEHRNDDSEENDIIISPGRYKDIENVDEMNVASTVLYRDCQDYIAITMGNSVGNIKILVDDENVTTSHSFIYKIESCSTEECNDTNPEISMEVVVQKGKETKIVSLASGQYKISIVPSWSWRYSETVEYNVTENSVKQETVSGETVNVLVYTDQYTEVKTTYNLKNKKWLSKTDITTWTNTNSLNVVSN